MMQKKSMKDKQIIGNMIELRPYQKEAKEALETYRLSGGKKGLVVAATGVGKRIMAVEYASNFRRVLFVAHREELITQALDDFEKEYPMEVGLILGEKNEINKRITITSIQTLSRRRESLPKRLFDAIFIDEAHHYLSKQWNYSVLYFDCEFLLGLTATPTRLDGLSMSNMFEKIVYNYPIERAIKEKYLCEIDARRIKTDIDLSSVHTQMGDFKSDELSRTVDIPARNKLIVEKYLQYAKGRQFIAFCVDIKHAQNLKNEFVKEGLNVECIHSNLSKEDRNNITNSFKSGKIDGVTNCQIYSEGFDYNDVGCVTMARPTKSLALFLQFLGRGTRLKSEEFQSRFNKNNAIILDFVDNVGKHKLINCWEIEKDKSIEDRVLISEEKKNLLIESRNAREKEERERRKAFIDKLYKHDRKIDLLELPKVVQSTGAWKRLSPTEAQIAFIKRLGIYEEGMDYTRGQISEIISNEPATQAQIAALAKFNYNVIEGCTRGQAELAFLALQEKGLVRKREASNRCIPPLAIFNKDK